MVYLGGSLLVMILSIYCWLEAKRVYEAGEVLPLRVSIAVWILDILHALLVIYASLNSVWTWPLDRGLMRVLGGIALPLGLMIMAAGMMEFGSLRRISGRDKSSLVTTGIYRWSRNPQYMGWFLALLGISALGNSGLAFVLTAAAMLGIHLYILMLEEPYLERIFGEQYRVYRLKTPRYLDWPREMRRG